jgi:hypothetical protein
MATELSSTRLFRFGYGINSTRSHVEVKQPSCRTCFGYIAEVKKYLSTNPFGYSDAFTARYPWEVKSNIFQPLLDYIYELARLKQTNHHYIYDLKYLNAIFDWRYIQTHYSFAYALEEYDYMMSRLRYVCCLLGNDQYIETQILVLEESLALEITRARNGHFYRPCSCGSTLMSTDEFNKKTRISQTSLDKPQT